MNHPSYCCPKENKSAYWLNVFILLTLVLPRNVFSFSAAGMDSDVASSTARKNRYKYRRAQEADIPNIASLLEETFQDVDEKDRRQKEKSNWTTFLRSFGGEQPLISKKKKRMQDVLRKRWSSMVQNPSVAHSWIVAIPVDQEASSTLQPTRIAGFMEVGTMPMPATTTSTSTDASSGLPSEKNDDNIASTVSIKNNKSDSTASETAFSWDEMLEKKEEPQSKRTSLLEDRPFLANLAVDSKDRRQGIAVTLVQLALQISKKWSGGVAGAETMTICKENDVSLWLSVEVDNTAARKLYEKLDFEVVIDESLTLNRRILQKLGRPPRLYLQKKITKL